MPEEEYEYTNPETMTFFGEEHTFDDVEGATPELSVAIKQMERMDIHPKDKFRLETLMVCLYYYGAEEVFEIAARGAPGYGDE